MLLSRATAARLRHHTPPHLVRSTLRVRTTSTTAGTMNRRPIGARVVASLTMAAGALLYWRLSPAPSSDSNPRPTISTASPLTLARSYLVFTCCSIPGIVDNSTSILKFLTRSPIPGVKAVTEAVVRRTFFSHFVAGESVADCWDVMTDLRSRGVGTLLNYAAEAGIDEGKDMDSECLEQLRLKEVEGAIIEAGRFETAEAARGATRGSTMFALKITALIDPTVLHRASNTLLRFRATRQDPAPTAVGYPGVPTDDDVRIVASSRLDDDPALLSLSGPIDSMGVLAADDGLHPGDLVALYKLWGKLKALGDLARENGVKILVDAEHSWYQPAIDAYTQLLSEEFNRPREDLHWNGPLIYGTYQSYLTRQPALIRVAIKHAHDNGYALGVKLVRGAYIMQERSKWNEEGRLGADPIWPTKPATDQAFNDSIQVVLKALAEKVTVPDPDPRLAPSIVFGTHNSFSVNKIIEGLEEHGLATRDTDGRLRMKENAKGKVFIGQLYGMKDDLMDLILQRFYPDGHPISVKYVAYGKLSEVIPFLGRRAAENKSLLSGTEGAGAERMRVINELKRRLYGSA